MVATTLEEKVRKRLINNNRKELKLENGSRIMVVSCGTKESVRGTTLRFVHVSEAAFCNEYIDRQILAIEQCLTSDGQIVVESTANGFNFFSDMYSKATQNENMYKPFFFGWVDDKLMFADEYKQFTERYIALHGKLPTIDELDSAELALYHRGATIEQIVWRRRKISNSSETQFAQEFPSTPHEAFITTGDKRPVTFDGWEYDDNMVIDVEQYEKIVTAIDQRIAYTLAKSGQGGETRVLYQT